MTARRSSSVILLSVLALLMARLSVLALLVAGATLARAQVPGSGQPAPEITGGPWINSAPLTLQGLRGRVVLVEFWTYG
jgi:hypothetical protein